MKKSARDKIITILELYTQKDAAKILGVSTRTIRRWKNEGVTPSKNLAPKLNANYDKISRSIKRSNKKTTTVKTGRIIPIGTRRTLKVYNRRREHTGDYTLSDWVTFEVSKLSKDDIIYFLQQLREQGRIVQIVYLIPGGSEAYPKQRAGTPMTDLSGATDKQFNAFLNGFLTYAHFYKPNTNVLFISVLDIRK